MLLDARRPLFVFRGAWNPAIFQPPWLAKYLFDIESGQEVEAIEMTVLTPVSQKITYINDIGITASNNGVDIFANGMDEQTLAKAETVAIRLLETLSHTPIGGFGVNFFFTENEPSDDLLDCLHTKDSIDKHFKILKQEFSAAIAIDSVILNFSRKPTDSNVQFDFNYHHSQQNFDARKELTMGITGRFLERSTEILDQLYSLKKYEVLKHEIIQNPLKRPLNESR